MDSSKKKTPEAWHAEVLKEEAEQLVFLLRALEFNLGFKEGEHSGFHLGVNANALALRATEEEPGKTA